jgi:hypothetical protein
MVALARRSAVNDGSFTNGQRHIAVGMTFGPGQPTWSGADPPTNAAFAARTPRESSSCGISICYAQEFAVINAAARPRP